MTFLWIIPEAAFLALSLSLDTFVAGLSYGSSKIRLPLVCAVTVSLVCSGVLCLSMLAGSLVRPFLSPIAARLICFLLLVCMGTLRILDQAIKSFLCRHDGFSRNFMFRALHFQFFLSVYADPCKADADASKSLSVPESVCLALAMSLDGAAAGFGAALGNLNPVAVLFFSLLFGFTTIQGGFLLGNRLAQKIHFSVDWLSGALLILLAFLRLI